MLVNLYEVYETLKKSTKFYNNFDAGNIFFFSSPYLININNSLIGSIGEQFKCKHWISSEKILSSFL